MSTITSNECAEMCATIESLYIGLGTWRISPPPEYHQKLTARAFRFPWNLQLHTLAEMIGETCPLKLSSPPSSDACVCKMQSPLWRWDGPSPRIRFIWFVYAAAAPVITNARALRLSLAYEARSSLRSGVGDFIQAWDSREERSLAMDGSVILCSLLAFALYVNTFTAEFAYDDRWVPIL